MLCLKALHESSTSTKRLAKVKYNIGMEFFREKLYVQAISMFTQAIHLNPNDCAFYHNRAECYVMLNLFEHAKKDAYEIIKFDAVMGYITLLKCTIKLGDVKMARQIKRSVVHLDNAMFTNLLQSLMNLRKHELKASKAFTQDRFEEIVKYMDVCISEAPGCLRYKIMKAESLVFLKRFEEADAICNNILNSHKQNGDAAYVKGLSIFLQSNIGTTIKHDTVYRALHYIKAALLWDPDNDRNKLVYNNMKLYKTNMWRAQTELNLGNFYKAYAIFTEVVQLNSSPNSILVLLHYNNGRMLLKENKLLKAIEEFSAALRLDKTYVPALIKRGKCYMQITEYKLAVDDLDEALYLGRCVGIKKMLKKAREALKKFSNHYDVLGVAKNATTSEIKVVYKRLVTADYPYKANGAEQHKIDKRYRNLIEAFKVLTNTKRRAAYDMTI